MESMLVLGWGLADNKKPFLWIIRPDLVIGGLVILSSEFVNETKKALNGGLGAEKGLNFGRMRVIATDVNQMRNCRG